MKNQLNVTFTNNQFVLKETKTVVTETVLAETLDTKAITEAIVAAGYKSAKFTADAKEQFKLVANADKIAAKAAKESQRKEKQALRESKKAEKLAQLDAKIAKLQEAKQKLV